MPEICLTSCPSVLDVTQDKTYEVLTNFLGELADVFPDPVLMLGGDEVGLSCHDPATGKALLSTAFDLDPAAAARMKTLGINSSTATDYFWRQISGKVMQSKKLKNKRLRFGVEPGAKFGTALTATLATRHLNRCRRQPWLMCGVLSTTLQLRASAHSATCTLPKCPHLHNSSHGVLTTQHTAGLATNPLCQCRADLMQPEARAALVGTSPRTVVLMVEFGRAHGSEIWTQSLRRGAATSKGVIP